ncbi:hypothetical protein GGR42_002733 [Saonia flava]|uniref:ASPIC/UnbV domain-containing protein n=1 Tax=Saonia flava TaxID=523696 RepID=A0A846QZY6_9FLAO|nr:VCBS repeat-containing protein [Saonia flava]NJB72242.1 hypothetical protein [Saonia flava]
MKKFVKIKTVLCLSAFIAICIGCGDNQSKKKKTTSDKLFELVSSSKSNINFRNTVKEDFAFNGLNYSYTYNGGGVAIGDINNDGLDDIYLVSNQQSNKLYTNQGDFEFKDETIIAGVEDMGGWSTGTSMIDINNDGWLDIYVCKSASMENEKLRRNKLYVNQGNGTFKEEAKKWGLDDNGFSIQSYFLDYDKDGDVDMFLVNHRNDFVNANALEDRKDRKYFSETSDHLFRNDGNKFTDVTLSSGIMNKEYSLSASIGDFNNDGWPDVYVANDFITPDYLYINNKNGTFSNQINQRIKHTSYSSMGSDYADINNDFLPDLLVLDMSAEDHIRGKQNMPSMNTKGFWRMVNEGYHYSYMSNILNLNKGNGSFSDVGQLAGVSKTDWSWAPLIADFDNDGHKDIVVTNGISYELGNQDYRKILKKRQDSLGADITVEDLLSSMPSEKLANYIFKNNGDLTFTNKTKDWGLDMKVNSSGVAYSDLDNDGDLDLVINNIEDIASIYKNNSVGNYINLKLIGDEKNKGAIGAKVKVYSNEIQQSKEHYLSRGYQSSMSPTLNFGLGEEELINRIEVIWADNTVLAMDNIEPNQTLVFDKKDFKFDGEMKKAVPQGYKKINPEDLGIDFKHQENIFNDFERQVLLPQKKSQQGPCIEVADVNNDGLDDFFIGGALNQPAEMYVQTNNGTFDKVSEALFVSEKKYEDIGAHFFDADSDGDIDLYVASSGYELDENSSLLQDRLYMNKGDGTFSKSYGLPKMVTSTKSVQSIDFDGDGDLDLAIGGNVVPGKYPLAPRSYFLENTNGKFKDVTKDIAPEFLEVGIVNDLIFSDYDSDGDKDLIVVGEWMPITVFDFSNGVFSKKIISEFKDTNGWWNTIKEVDLDKDGDMDYLVGNLGNNNKFHPTKEKPLHIYGNNYDNNDTYDMLLSKVYNGKLVPVRGKECSTEQNAFISERIQTYKEFANSSLIDIYGEEEIGNSYHKEVYTFSSLYVYNNGDGTFAIEELPTNAQVGPTMSFTIDDVNKDGFMDVLGVGSIFEAEVETIRYDSNTGYILLGDEKGNLHPYIDISFYNYGNIKDMGKIKVAGQDYFLMANNDGPITIYGLK